MPAQAPEPHPCQRRDAFAPWKPDHLYIGDDGQVLCGGCMGTESTYTPWAFSDLGRMDGDRKVVIAVRPLAGGRPEPTEFRCEIDHAHRRKLLTQRRIG